MARAPRITSLGVAAAALALACQATQGATDTAASAAAMPSGYYIASSFFSAATGTQTFGSVTCPKTSAGSVRRPQGGGVIINSTSPFAGVNGSIPAADGVSWDAWVNNSTGATVNIGVYALCATPRSGYVVLHATYANPAGMQSSGTVACPTGTKVIGGGGVLSSSQVLANINTTIPQGNGWGVDANNGTTSSETFDVYAVCSKYGTKQNYGVHAGAAVDNPPETQSRAFAPCPLGTSALGGGVYSSSASTSVNLNGTSMLSSGGWTNYENNATQTDYSLTPYVICAS
jgi:hypothetical protein